MLTPPVVIRTSQRSSAVAKLAASSRSSSRTIPRFRTSAPRGEVERVALADLARPGRPVGGHELVAGRQHRDARSAPDEDRLGAAGGEHREVDLRDPPAARQDDLPRAQVLAAVADVLFRPRTVGGRDPPTAVERPGLLDDHDRVAACGQLRAGVDRDALAGPDRPSPGRAGARLAGDGELDLARVRVMGVGGAHRVAVHRALLEGRQVEVAGDVRREHAPEGLRKRDVLGWLPRLDPL